MTRIVAGLVLLSVLSVLALTPKAEKKSVGAELVPAGTLYSPGVLVGDTLYIPVCRVRIHKRTRCRMTSARKRKTAWRTWGGC